MLLTLGLLASCKPAGNPDDTSSGSGSQSDTTESTVPSAKTISIDISKYTKKIVTENIIFALAIKLIALIIGITGVLSSLGMLIAIFADVGTCLICILNVMRILRCRKKSK